MVITKSTQFSFEHIALLLFGDIITTSSFCFFWLSTIIIKYKDGFAAIRDLADLIRPKGLLSEGCGRVAIEYLRNMNKVQGKTILPPQIAKFLMRGEHHKWMVTQLFERKKDFALSCQDQVSFLSHTFFVFCSAML